MRERSFDIKNEASKDDTSFFKLDLPEVKPLSLMQGGLIVTGVMLVGLTISSAIATQIFFGAASLAGLVMLIESSPHIKWIVIKGNIFIDVAIFLASIYAVGSLGPTIAGGLVVAGIGYTGIVAPRYRYLDRERRRKVNNI